MELEVSSALKKIDSIGTWELIEKMKSTTLSPIENEKLSNEFHSRFKNWFFRICLKVCSTNTVEDRQAELICQDTFIKAIRGIKGFNIDKTLPEQRMRSKVIGWMGKIANRELINYLRKKKKQIPVVDDETDLDEFSGDISETDVVECLSEQRLKLDKALSLLNERDRYILKIYAAYDCLDNDDHLPAEELDDICRQFNINRDYIRLIKYRAYKKVKKYSLETGN